LKGSKIYVFPCNRWLARDEDDKAIERDLIPEKIIDEKLDHGELKSREKNVRNHLERKKIFHFLWRVVMKLNIKFVEIRVNSAE
jgi:hypothetical protein